MIRLVVTTSDFGAAANIGGVVNTFSKVFEVEHPALEAALSVVGDAYTSVSLSFEPKPKAED